jgi:ParB family chromosome partitioning protein
MPKLDALASFLGMPTNIPITDIDEPKRLLRLVDHNSVEFEELRHSITHNGVLNAILVRPVGDRYELVDGFNRYSAAKLVGLTELPCIVQSMTDEEFLVRQFECNAVRISTKPVEFAIRIQQLLNANPGWTLNDVSKCVHKSPAWIAKILCILDLDVEILVKVNRGVISLGNAIWLKRIPGDLRPDYLARAESLSVKAFAKIAGDVVKQLQEQITSGTRTKILGFEPVPFLRTFREIKTEMFTSAKRANLLKYAKATTAEEGYTTALKWACRLDPASIEKQQLRHIERTEHDCLNSIDS